jgi:hypothetical protein
MENELDDIEEIEEIGYLTEEELEQANNVGIIDNNFLVYFDKTSGNIISMTNERRDTDEPYITMPYEDIKLFLEGKQNFNDFKIIFEKDEITLVSKKVSNDINFNSLATVNITKSVENSLTVENHLDVKHWGFTLREDLKIGLQQKILDVNLEFYVCINGNKNFPVRTMTIPLEQLVKEKTYFIPHELVIESDKTKIIIVTKKFFDTYGLRILNESKV